MNHVHYITLFSDADMIKIILMMSMLLELSEIIYCIKYNLLHVVFA